MEEEKSPIFPLPFHSNRVKMDLSFCRRIRDGSYWFVWLAMLIKTDGGTCFWFLYAMALDF